MKTERPSYDAVLLHGYWLSRSSHPDNLDGFRGSLRTRLVTRAGVDLYCNEGPTNLVFVGAKLKGPSYPSTANLFAQEASEKYGIPPKHIHIAHTGFGTEAESLEFETLATKNGWRNVATVSFEEHSPSVQRFRPNIKLESGTANVEHRTVQELIAKYDNHHVAHLVERLSRTINTKPRVNKYHLGFVLYELAKTTVMSLPNGKNRLYARTKKARTEKDNSFINDLITRQIDVYRS
jgi:hypothetical protein